MGPAREALKELVETLCGASAVRGSLCVDSILIERHHVRVGRNVTRVVRLLDESLARRRSRVRLKRL